MVGSWRASSLLLLIFTAAAAIALLPAVAHCQQASPQPSGAFYHFAIINFTNLQVCGAMQCMELPAVSHGERCPLDASFGKCRNLTFRSTTCDLQVVFPSVAGIEPSEYTVNRCVDSGSGCAAGSDQPLGAVTASCYSSTSDCSLRTATFPAPSEQAGRYW